MREELDNKKAETAAGRTQYEAQKARMKNRRVSMRQPRIS